MMTSIGLSSARAANGEIAIAAAMATTETRCFNETIALSLQLLRASMQEGEEHFKPGHNSSGPWRVTRMGFATWSRNRAAGGDTRSGAAHRIDERQRILGHGIAAPGDMAIGPHQHQRLVV